LGSTISEKILARASGRSQVSPGEYVEISSGRPITLHASMERGPAIMKELGINRVFNPELINIVDGHVGVAASQKIGEVRRQIERWAREVGIPEEHIFLVGRSGIEHVFAGEKCWPLPGDCFFQVVNGHTPALGALGAFAVSLSYGSGAYLVTGKTWVKVPETVKVKIKGTLPKGVMARDVSEYILGQIGPTGCSGQVIEFHGPTIDAMEMDSRFSLCCNVLFTGAWTAIINPDYRTIEYIKKRTKDNFDPLVSDDDAGYSRILDFDIGNLCPQVVPPPERHTVKQVSQVEGTSITNGFIGSCANSRIEDIRISAKILKGERIYPGVILNITPGTPEIYKQAMKENLLEILLDAGAVIAPPACGMCLGYYTPLASGDVCISTGTCNYPGRMGSKNAEIYLASPATVAASCIEGKITDPRKLL
jgi:3-isopropylmalate/(R)-2-methylmalate dehydratase large subunit